jgi:hypothetical protein
MALWAGGRTSHSVLSCRLGSRLPALRSRRHSAFRLCPKSVVSSLWSRGPQSVVTGLS